MVRGVLTEFRVPVARASAFEAFMRRGMKRSRRAKGQLGAILLRAAKGPNNYLMLAFWQTKRDRVSFLRSIKAREKVRTFVTKEPRARWVESLARVQDSRFLAAG